MTVTSHRSLNSRRTSSRLTSLATGDRHGWRSARAALSGAVSRPVACGGNVMLARFAESLVAKEDCPGQRLRRQDREDPGRVHLAPARRHRRVLPGPRRTPHLQCQPERGARAAGALRRPPRRGHCPQADTETAVLLFEPIGSSTPATLAENDCRGRGTADCLRTGR